MNLQIRASYELLFEQQREMNHNKITDYKYAITKYFIKLQFGGPFSVIM